MMIPEQQMMKCDMCYDRTSIGKRPMCATVCPSQALSYVRPEEIASRREKPTNIFYFGSQKITTKVYMMAQPNERLSLWMLWITCGRRTMNWLRRGSSGGTPSEPLWKEEFSVRTADERYVTRRQLTKFLVLTSLGCSWATFGF